MRNTEFYKAFPNIFHTMCGKLGDENELNRFGRKEVFNLANNVRRMYADRNIIGKINFYKQIAKLRGVTGK